MKIVFAHNVFNRLHTLKNTILIEKNIFPDANVSIACNDVFVNIFSDITNFSAVSFNERPHKIGCVNGCILSIQRLLKIDFDVLIFSHDDVYINTSHFDIVKKNINSIISGEYDIICRTPINPDLGKDYYMMEVFYASKTAIVKLFTDLKTLKSENEIPVDKRNCISPEVWFYNLLKNNNLKIKELAFENNSVVRYNDLLGLQMGYCHKNAGLRGWID